MHGGWGRQFFQHPSPHQGKILLPCPLPPKSITRTGNSNRCAQIHSIAWIWQHSKPQFAMRQPADPEPCKSCEVQGKVDFGGLPLPGFALDGRSGQYRSGLAPLSPMHEEIVKGQGRSAKGPLSGAEHPPLLFIALFAGHAGDGRRAIGAWTPMPANPPKTRRIPFWRR